MKLIHFKSDFFKNSFILIGGTLIAQLIPLVLQLYLRRIYTPEDFGAFAIYFNLLSVFIIFCSLRYEAAVVLPKNDVLSINVLSLSISLTFCFGILFFIFLLIFNDVFCRWVNFPIQYANYLYILPFSAILFSIYQILNYWLIRNKLFKSSAINKVSRRFFEGITQVGFSGVKNYGLFLGDFIGNLANVLSGIFQINRKSKIRIDQISFRKMQFAAVKFKEFPLYNLVPTLLSSIANIIPFVFINKFYSTEELGYIDLVKMVLSIPLAFISVTISQVLFQQVSANRNDAISIWKTIQKTAVLLISVGILEVIIIQIWAPELFSFIFGSKYFVSGEYAQILVFSFVFNFITSSFSSIFIALEKILYYSVWQSSYFIFTCSLWFFKKFRLTDFLKIYVSVEVLMGIIFCVMFCFVVHKYERTLISKFD
jgi:O-antigen/teichoic acid export membrane protein